jgi:cytochrome P450 family 135
MKIPQELQHLPRTGQPALLNAASYWLQVDRFTDRLAELGDRFVVTMPGTGAWAGLTHPKDIENVFRAPSGVVHLGEALRMLSPHELVLGPAALTSLDGERHLRKRRQLLPLFHGEALKRYEPTIEAKARELAAGWPVGEPAEASGYAQRVALEVIMAGIFGITDGGRLNRLRAAILDLMAEVASRRFLLEMAISNARNDHFERPFPRIEGHKAAIDAIVHEEIAARGDDPDGDGRDILGRLLAARDEAGRRMETQEICDDMRTLLLAGHDTTGATIAWVLERLVHEPGALREATRTVRNGEDAYLDAVIHETLRLRSVFPFSVRLTKQPLELDGLTVPAETLVIPYIALVHRRADIYPDPLAFRPERFLGTRPGSYTWIPFGGGIRRCVGASLAMLETHIVIRTLLQEFDLHAVHPRPEAIKRRTIVITPGRGALVTATPTRASASNQAGEGLPTTTM